MRMYYTCLLTHVQTRFAITFILLQCVDTVERFGICVQGVTDSMSSEW